MDNEPPQTSPSPRGSKSARRRPHENSSKAAFQRKPKQERHKHPEGGSSRAPERIPTPDSSTPATAAEGCGEPPQAQPRSRRSRFNGKITQPTEDQGPSRSSPTPKPKPKHPRGPTGDDLTSTLTRSLRTAPYLDCPICFNPVRPEHPTWSCSPPQDSFSEDEKERLQCCWTTFHLKCIRSWAEKSVKDIVEAWRARGEVRPGEWRCPGCQMKRERVPTTYWCFCNRTSNPSPPRGMSTPHSCALPCSRPRISGCGHPCPLPCHPGPCPPCKITVRKSCFCGKALRNIVCKNVGNPNPESSDGLQQGSFSCMAICDRQLSCENPSHKCRLACHLGPCPPCEVTEEVQCWCGGETNVVGCGEMKSEEAIQCVVSDNMQQTEKTWIGRFGCGKTCNRAFACGKHTCSKLCHPPSRLPPPCPFDPASVTYCACGRYQVARAPDSRGGSQSNYPLALPERTSCTSPLPVCPSVCSKVLPCGHTCKSICHWGACPPCTNQIERPCRCGSTKRPVQCGITDGLLDPNSEPNPGEIICNRPCRALRTCGRHRCGRLCCPLASVTPSKPKGKTRTAALEDLQVDAGGLHECDIPCRRVLGCGNHRCERKDHPGSCGVCLQAIFEELACPCGRTVLEPPIACGTRLTCAYPCARPLPPCGHPRVPHACHEAVIVAGADTAEEGLGSSEGHPITSANEGRGTPLGDDATTSNPCPPCPWLTSKRCTCGKKTVDNVPCSQVRVHCGIICGRLMPCGFHHCQRTCHEDECGACTAVCGKSRKSCLPEHHPCTQTCHAPAACPETESCLATVTLACPCGNLRSMVPCSANKQNPTCNSDCDVKKRNARLAEAFGISDQKNDTVGSKVVWNDALTAFARVPGNTKFVRSMEATFADFIKSDRRAQVLPHMSLEQRQFIQGFASVYRIDTCMVDQEPHRSVQLIRRIDTRIPTPLLGQATPSTPSLGKLIDLRSAVAQKGVGGSTTASTTASPAWGGPSRVPSPLRGADTKPSTARVCSAPGSEVPPSGRVWVSPSVQAQRAQATAPATAVVPDSWEDDT